MEIELKNGRIERKFANICEILENYLIENSKISRNFENGAKVYKVPKMKLANCVDFQELS